MPNAIVEGLQRREDPASGLVVAAGLEDVEGTAGVHREGFTGMVLAGRYEGHAREMDHGVRRFALDQCLEGGGVGDVDR